MWSELKYLHFRIIVKIESDNMNDFAQSLICSIYLMNNCMVIIVY